MGGTGDACNVGDVVLREHLRLRLVQPQVPPATEVVQLLDGLRHLSPGIGLDEHVVGEG